MLDAEETLGQFMTGDQPDQELFEKNVGVIVRQVLVGRGETVIRAYGEMVDVLWNEGRTEAALILESLWNKLIVGRRLALLCGYSMAHFYKHPNQLARVRGHHTHVLHGDNVVPFQPKRGT